MIEQVIQSHILAMTLSRLIQQIVGRQRLAAILSPVLVGGGHHPVDEVAGGRRGGAGAGFED